MSKNTITQFQNASLEDIADQTSNIIDAAFEKHLEKFQPKPEVTFLTRKEVAKILKISLPTLNEWNKLGILKPYRIGRLVRYKSAELEEALTRIKKNQD